MKINFAIFHSYTNNVINQSKHVSEKGVDGATRAESEEAIHIKVEDPQVAPKSPVLSRVPSSPLENTELAPLCLCPRGRW